ncbi:MAG: hypothetical protein RI949_1789 [Pseudomonadota bacterium]|jgi:hypothetical protein
MRTLELTEVAHVSGGLVGAESGSLLCDAAVTRPPGTNAWGEVPTMLDHLSSVWGAISASTVETLKTNAQFFLDNGLLSWVMGTNTGVGADGLRTDGKDLGYGCGDAGTDRAVPDRLFGVDLTSVCVNHDRNYSKCGSKEEADAIFKKEIFETVNAARGPVLAAIAAEIYFQGVSKGGQAAYESGCPTQNP